MVSFTYRQLCRSGLCGGRLRLCRFTHLGDGTAGRHEIQHFVRQDIVADRVERPRLFHLTPNVLQPLLRPFRQTRQVGFHIGVFDCEPFALGDLIESRARV